MRFLWLQQLESTQVFLSEYVRVHEGRLDSPFIVATKEQTEGIGSRHNTWDKVACGLYLSCAMPLSFLPNDLPKQSASIYFGQILFELLRGFHKDLWLKWPNDFYINTHKVGGLMTQYIKGCVIFGVGINIVSTTRFALLSEAKVIESIHATTPQKQRENTYTDSIHANGASILSAIMQKILHFLSFNIVEFDLQKNMIATHNAAWSAFLHDTMTWRSVLERYKQNFFKNHGFYAHSDEKNRIALQHAQLQDDGSIMVDNRILYSLR